MSRKTKLPALPSPTDSNALAFSKAVKGILDVREGLVGDELDSNVTFRDLVDIGTLSLSGGGYTPSGGGGGVIDPPDTTPPPGPLGLTATGALTSILLQWNSWSYSSHAYTEIWRSDSPSFGGAVRIGTSQTRFYSDAVGSTAKTYWYWIRFVSTAGIEGPFNAPTGTSAQTGQDVSLLMTTLTGAITQSQLFSSLSGRIDLIDGSSMVPGSVNARIAAEASARSSGDAATLTSANSYVATYTYAKATIDDSISGLGTILRAEFAAADAATLSSANAYTNTTVAATGIGAIATSVTTLQAQVNTPSATPGATAYNPTYASLQTFSSAQATVNGNLSAQYTVKIDLAGHVAGYGLASSSTIAGGATSAFGIRADQFWVSPPATVSATAPVNEPPTSYLYRGRVWVDTSVTPNVTRYYTGTAWSTTPQAFPFIVQAAPTSIGGVTIDPGVYMDAAFIRKASITDAMIGSLAADKITAGYTTSVDLESGVFAGSEFYIGGTVTYEYSDPAAPTKKTGIASVANPNVSLTSAGARFNVGYFQIFNGTTFEVPFEVSGGVVRAKKANIDDLQVTSAKIANVLNSTNWNGSWSTPGSFGDFGTAGWAIEKGGTAVFNSLRARGNVMGGGYSAYAWPASGQTGFYIGPEGLLVGNGNDGKYLQVTAGGDIYAPQFAIVAGNAYFTGNITGASGTFSGALAANTVNTSNIVGSAVTSGYSASSGGYYVGITVTVPAGATSLMVVAHIGNNYRRLESSSSKDAYYYTDLPLANLYINGSVVTTQKGTLVWSTPTPTAGTYDIVVYRDVTVGQIYAAVLVTKR